MTIIQSANEEECIITTVDNVILQATLFVPPTAEVAILVSGGTGIPRRIYRKMGEYFASRNAVVLTYDYRGLDSCGGATFDASNVNYWDWGKFDMSAAAALLSSRFPDLKLVHIAHSAGAHFVGLMPNHQLVSRHIFVCAGSGFWRTHHLRNWLKEMYFWWILGPVCLARWGYIPPVGGWRGRALPEKVFRTWRRWCHQRDYFKNDMTGPMAPTFYDQVSAPILAWIPTDDPIATPKSVAEINRFYDVADIETVFVEPAHFEQPDLGHDGVFRRNVPEIWQEWLDWLLKDVDMRLETADHKGS
ncbi:alpha/beta hydrolase [uncultured Litoreibacter sp.]|uniref:alpha/beta hydrolase family protein n=1 Tax=uncultured Litoreibacter sp. TaxID=1392394 RepID=UPI00262A73F5|nr:alpha/beta hydrolase [uncultured Litoreibacter sp.]